MRVDITWTHKDHMLIKTLDDIDVYIAEGSYTLHIKSGFTSDGATIPKILWFVLSPFEEYFKSCIIHDYLCDKALMSDDVYKNRKFADTVFNESMKRQSTKDSTRIALYSGVVLWRWLRYNKLSLKLFSTPTIDEYNEAYFYSSNIKETD